MNRFAEYEGFKIEASPTILVKQRLFRSGVLIECPDGTRLIFSDLGNRVFRWQAYERGIEWAKGWIDTNFVLNSRVRRRDVPGLTSGASPATNPEPEK